MRERTHIHLGNAKVAIFIAAVIYSGYALAGDPSPAIYGDRRGAVHRTVDLARGRDARAGARAGRRRPYYADGIARIEDRWMRDTPSGDRFRDRNHPYADDLDVFGPAVSFSCCRRAARRWGRTGWPAGCCAPRRSPTSASARSRVAALRGRIDLRERIASSMPDASDRFMPTG